MAAREKPEGSEVGLEAVVIRGAEVANWGVAVAVMRALCVGMEVGWMLEEGAQAMAA